MYRLDDPTTLSLLFHLNSEPWLNDTAYESAGRQETLRGERPAIGLPPPGETALTTLLRERRSCRAFARRPMALETVSALAAAAQGVVETGAAVGDGHTMVRRAAPSAGGLYPLELHAFVRRVDGLADGLYAYDPLGHALEELRRGALEAELAAALYAWPFVAGANVLLALVARFAQTQKKYGPRGYRYILLEAGHAVENVCLRATELGLATLCIGGFVDTDVNRLLALSPSEAGVVYMVAAGYAEG
jgi:SagB-type dehydrogenase family enzyme